MKRKDFLRKMRSRRRGDQLELREPERRRAIDWRTVRVDLPAGSDSADEQLLSPGVIVCRSDGIQLRPSHACWVRGYRVWTTDEGQGRAEFQYRPVDGEDAPPPGAVALAADQVWEPTG